MARCTAIKANGGQCERVVPDSSKLCYSHDPERAEERRAYAVKGGKTTPSRSADLRLLREELRGLMAGVVNGNVDKGRASVAAQVAGVLVRCHEQERRALETEELERRIAELETEERDTLRCTEVPAYGW